MDLAKDLYLWMLRHESDTWIRRRESEDVDLVEDPYWWMLRHESDTWILQRILRYEDVETWIRRHGSCRGSWEKDAETWIRRHGSCKGSIVVDARPWIGDMAPAEECRESWDTKCTEDTDICLVNNFHAICWMLWLCTHCPQRVGSFRLPGGYDSVRAVKRGWDLLDFLHVMTLYAL